jgi:hypothetical protein
MRAVDARPSDNAGANRDEHRQNRQNVRPEAAAKRAAGKCTSNSACIQRHPALVLRHRPDDICQYVFEVKQSMHAITYIIIRLLIIIVVFAKFILIIILIFKVTLIQIIKLFKL